MGWKLAVFQTLSCTLPKFSEAYQSLEFTGCSTFGTTFLASFCMTFSRIGVIWAPFGVQNCDFWSSGSIFSVHLETLVTTGAPKGKITLICRPPWCHLGIFFQVVAAKSRLVSKKSATASLMGQVLVKVTKIVVKKSSRNLQIGALAAAGAHSTQFHSIPENVKHGY